MKIIVRDLNDGKSYNAVKVELDKHGGLDVTLEDKSVIYISNPELGVVKDED